MSQGQEFRAAVGEVAQAAALLESVTAIILWGLAGVEQRIARIVLPNNMDRMYTLIKELVPLRVDDPALRATVLEWAGEARAAHGQRGRILHSVWVGPGDDSPHFRADLRPLGGEAFTATAADLQALAQQLHALAEGDRMEFIGELVATVPGPWSAGPESARPPLA